MNKKQSPNIKPANGIFSNESSFSTIYGSKKNQNYSMLEMSYYSEKQVSIGHKDSSFTKDHRIKTQSSFSIFQNRDDYDTKQNNTGLEGLFMKKNAPNQINNLFSPKSTNKNTVNELQKKNTQNAIFPNPNPFLEDKTITNGKQSIFNKDTKLKTQISSHHSQTNLLSKKKDQSSIFGNVKAMNQSQSIFDSPKLNPEKKEQVTQSQPQKTYYYHIGCFIIENSSRVQMKSLLSIMQENQKQRIVATNKIQKVIAYLHKIGSFIDHYQTIKNVQKIDQNIIALGIVAQQKLTPKVTEVIAKIAIKSKGCNLSQKEKEFIFSWVKFLLKEVENYLKINEMREVVEQEERRRKLLIESFLNKKQQKKVQNPINFAKNMNKSSCNYAQNQQYQDQEFSEQQQQSQQSQQEVEVRVTSNVQPQRIPLRQADSDEETAVTFDQEDEQEEERYNAQKEICIGFKICRILTKQKILALRATMSQYNGSNYFHVDPRYELLGTMEKIINAVTEPTNPQQFYGAQMQNYKNIGLSVMKFLTPNQISSLYGIIDSYNSSNYFHVGPRRSIFSSLQSIISIKCKFVP